MAAKVFYTGIFYSKRLCMIMMTPILPMELQTDGLYVMLSEGMASPSFQTHSYHIHPLIPHRQICPSQYRQHLISVTQYTWVQLDYGIKLTTILSGLKY